jgi:hypothetical protein
MCGNKGKYRTQQKTFNLEPLNTKPEVDVYPNGDFSARMSIDFLTVCDSSTYH